MLDDRDVIFVDHIVLIIIRGEDNRTMYGNSGADEGRYENVLIVDKGGINPTEHNICQTLPLSVGFLRLGSCAGSVVVLKEAGHLLFGLRVVGRDEFWHWSLRPRRYCSSWSFLFCLLLRLLPFFLDQFRVEGLSFLQQHCPFCFCPGVLRSGG